MFGNLINAGRTVAENVEQQRALYGGYGDMVIDVFVEKVIGLNLNGIINSRATIEAAMETKIKEVGPGNVSRHCGDPTQISVIDVGAAALPGLLGERFVASVKTRVKLIDERTSNSCFHMELVLS
ncbi:Peptidoglycan-binding domain 1 protein [Fragilaria crotonensis]|nr:Peptidoglycan-binding domain 1 protein [Fragilaria crotonensis]